MATTASGPVIDGSTRVSALKKVLDDLIAADQGDALSSVIDQIRARGRQLFDDRDLRGSVAWASMLDRVVDGLEQTSGLGQLIRGQLETELQELDLRIGGLTQHEYIAEQAEIALGVRGRVFKLIEERPGIRPKQIGEELGIHRTQVSRAVRELKEENLIEAAEIDDQDGRAVAYRVTTQSTVIEKPRRAA